MSLLNYYPTHYIRGYSDSKTITEIVQVRLNVVCGVQQYSFEAYKAHRVY